MLPFLLRLSERWTYMSLCMINIYCIPVTDILWYDLLTNTPFACHMVMNCPSCASTNSHPLNMKCVQCLDPEFDTANQYDCALLCNYTHNICTLHMISWPTMHFDPVQNMNLCTHSVRHMTHIKMFWNLKSSQTCVTWPLWGGRKGMSSNKPTIAPSPFGAVAIFKSYRLLKTNIVGHECSFIISQCGKCS